MGDTGPVDRTSPSGRITGASGGLGREWTVTREGSGPVRRRWWQSVGRKKNRRLESRDTTLPTPEEAAQARMLVVRRAASLLALVAISAGLSGGFVALHRFLTHSSHFAVRDIRVGPTRYVSPARVRTYAGVLPGDNLFALDLEDVRRQIERDPWLSSARVRRQLPSAILVDVEEKQPACAVALGGLYLADRRGEVFKKAAPSELPGLPVITGITRAGYVAERDVSQGLIRSGLRALEAWRSGSRPAVGEVLVDRAAGVTLYLSEGGTAIQLGRPDAAGWGPRLQRVDAVWKALAEEGKTPRRVFADQRTHPDRIVVSLVQPDHVADSVGAAR